MELFEALAQLDVANEDHWTSDGLPRLDVMKSLTGDSSITRDKLRSEAPDFSRANAVIPGAEEEEVNEDVTEEVEEGEETETTSEEDVADKTELEVAQEAYTAAKLAVVEAQKALQKASDDLDRVIGSKSAAEERKTQASDIKAFQKAQLEQRKRALRG